MNQVEQSDQSDLNLDISDLPESMRSLSELIGLEAVLKLMHLYGGQPVYIPSRYKESHKLAQYLGCDAFKKLWREFGGLSVQIPMGTRAISKARNRMIKAKRQHNSTGAQLARDYKLSQRQVWYILAAIKASDSQTEIEGRTRLAH